VFDFGTFDANTFDAGAPSIGPVPRDTHDGDWIPRRTRRFASVYSIEYYEQLKKGLVPEEPTDVSDVIIEFIEAPPSAPKQPNLLIPLAGLIDGIDLPSLIKLPPRLMPYVVNKDDDKIIALILLED
jgi:hypothetical protein